MSAIIKCESNTNDSKSDIISKLLPLKFQDCNLICSICLGILKQPMETSCGHLFCENCWIRYVTNKFGAYPNTIYSIRCPNCNTEISSSTFQFSKALQSLINNWPIDCNLAPVCTWKGSLADYTNHISKSCPHRMVECFHCNLKMTEINLNIHSASGCTQRPVQCPHCSGLVKFCDLESHFETCLEMFVSKCPQDCKLKYRRKDLGTHLSKVCPHTEVLCPLKCRQAVKRIDMEDHVKSATNFSSHQDEMWKCVKKSDYPYSRQFLNWVATLENQIVEIY